MAQRMELEEEEKVMTDLGEQNCPRPTKKCRKNMNQAAAREGQTMLSFLGKNDGEDSNKLSIAEFDQETLRMDVARMVIIDECPFQIVEKEGFRRLVSRLEPRFEIPSRMTVQRDCMKLCKDEKVKVKNLIKGQRLCLTTNTWTSCQQLNYMCLTGHWIDDDWVLQKKVLNFCVVRNHKRETIGRAVELCLMDWGIELFFTITVDNASPDDGAIRYIKRKTKNLSCTILEHEFIHMRCCCHILNLIVKDGLAEFNGSITKIRAAIRYVKSSPSTLDSFKRLVAIANIESKSLLTLDVETRWDSTYVMLDTALKFRKVFELLEGEDDNYYRLFVGDDMGDDEGEGIDSTVGSARSKNMNPFRGPLDENDWRTAELLVKFLRLFFQLIVEFSGSLYATSHLFFHKIMSVQAKLDYMSSGQGGDANLASMALYMKQKFDHYWDNLENINMLLYVAVVLDPRYKMNYLRCCIEVLYEKNLFKAKKLIEMVEKALELLYEHYQKNGLKLKDGVGTTSTQDNESLMHLPLDSFDILKFKVAKKLKVQETMKHTSELAKYMNDGCEEDQDSFNILSWWKANAIKYPIMSRMAKDVLAVQVSTVASQSAFSTVGCVLDPYRSSLAPNTIEALMCGQSWLHSTPMSPNLASLMEDINNIDELDSKFIDN